MNRSGTLRKWGDVESDREGKKSSRERATDADNQNAREFQSETEREDIDRQKPKAKEAVQAWTGGDTQRHRG